MNISNGAVAESFFSQPFIRVPIMFRKVPPAANPKSVILMTMKDRWFHWLMEKTLARRTSKARDDSDSKKTVAGIMGYCF
jgi:hypothetical protein